MAERPPLGAIHDHGCHCWPHVSAADVDEIVIRAGHAEYVDAKRDRAAARALGAAEERRDLRDAFDRIRPAKPPAVLALFIRAVDALLADPEEAPDGR